MASEGEGVIRIPLEDFWEFVAGFNDHAHSEVAYGVPSCDGYDIVINYAHSTSSHPTDWSEKPKCVEEWKELRKKQKESM